jgi:hypothetical protein
VEPSASPLICFMGSLNPCETDKPDEPQAQHGFPVGAPRGRIGASSNYTGPESFRVSPKLPQNTEVSQ